MHWWTSSRFPAPRKGCTVPWFADKPWEPQVQVAPAVSSTGQRHLVKAMRRAGEKEQRTAVGQAAFRLFVTYFHQHFSICVHKPGPF